jgi:flagellar motor switch protein FliN/FliY
MTPLEEIAHLHDVPIKLEIELDRRIMTLRELLGIQTGGVLRMSRSAGENINMLVDGVLLGFGEIVIIDDAMGVRVTGLNNKE